MVVLVHETLTCSHSATSTGFVVSLNLNWNTIGTCLTVDFFLHLLTGIREHTDENQKDGTESGRR